MYDTLVPGSAYDTIEVMSALEDNPLEAVAVGAAAALNEVAPDEPGPATGGYALHRSIEPASSRSVGGYALYGGSAPAAARPPLAASIGTMAALRSSATRVPAAPPAAIVLAGKKLDRHAMTEKQGKEVGGMVLHFPHRVVQILRQVFPTTAIWDDFAEMISQFRLDPSGNFANDFIPAPAQAKVLQIARALYGPQVIFTGKLGRSFRRHVMKCLINGVKYASTDVRRKYEVELSGAGIRRRGELLDTRKYYEDKKAKGQTIIGGSAAGGANDPNERFRFIWVITGTEIVNYKMFTNVPKLDRFHHSSFSAGKSIIAGGEWQVQNGRIDFINDCSGHYRPDFDRLLAALRWLNSRGALAGSTKVELFKGKQKVKVMAGILLSEGSAYCVKNGLTHFPG